MTVRTSLPEGIHPQAGDEMQFTAVMQADGTLLVTRILDFPDFSADPPSQSSRLMDWVNKWAGTLPVNPDETRAGLREGYLIEKFGLSKQ